MARARMEAAVAEEPTSDRQIQLLMPKSTVLRISIEGISPLLVHRKGKEVAEGIIANQQKKEAKAKGQKATQEPREAKDPFEEFRRSLHIIPGAEGNAPKDRISEGQCWPYIEGTFGFPVQGFKSALARLSEIKMVSIPKTVINALIRINEWDLVPLKYSRLQMHLAVLSVGFPPKADPRYRGMFHDWSTAFTVKYPENRFSKESVVNMFALAGEYMGLGENRAQKGGSLGLYRVSEVQELKAKGV